MICPDCNYDNIPGADTCERCGQPLTREQRPPSEMERSIVAHPVSVLTGKSPVSVAPTELVRDVVQVMTRHRIGCVLVCDGAQLVGIFTERDVLNRVSPDLTALDDAVGQHMTRAPEAVKPGDSIAYALHMMSINGVRHLPVVEEDGRAVGIISARDVLRLLAVRFANIRDD